MTDTLVHIDSVRQRFTVTGVVQGVGFRPFVHRIATELGLTGFVGNDSGAVFLEVQGPAARIDEFRRRLRAEAPPLAAISAVQVVDVDADTLCDSGFRIVESQPVAGATTPIPPDIAVCDDCIAELFDPSDRRYRHPFVTCTNCGPRFTIIRAPALRPTGHHHVGVRDVRALRRRIPRPGRPPLPRAADRLPGLRAVAVVRRARPSGSPDPMPRWGPPSRHWPRAPWSRSRASAAITWLAGSTTRRRSLRCGPVKRGAPSRSPCWCGISTSRAATHTSTTAEAAVLSSPARPIVLLRRRRDAPLADAVAPGSPLVGLMLPYSPIHHLLLAPVPGVAAPVPDALVLTSANRSDDPICFTEDDAVQRLPPLCDAVLDHDRPIHVPCDDSVVRVVDDRELPIRRSRGYAPLPVDLGRDGPAVLAVGGELKNTFCLTDGARAYLSGHIGDMETLETLRAFERAVGQLSEIRHQPVRLAADLHPGYHTRSWAERRAGDRPLDLIQHHHAHVVSLLAEHGRLGEPVDRCFV